MYNLTNQKEFINFKIGNPYLGPACQFEVIFIHEKQILELIVPFQASTDYSEKVQKYADVNCEGLFSISFSRYIHYICGPFFRHCDPTLVDNLVYRLFFSKVDISPPPL